MVSHLYAVVNVYTATVRAGKGTDVFTARTFLVVDEAISDLTAVNNSAADNIGLSMVEISTDGGQTWPPSTGLENWTYLWTLPIEYQVDHTLLARSLDLAGHVGISQPVEVIVNTKAPYLRYLPIIMR